MNHHKRYAREMAERLLSGYRREEFPSKAETIAQMATVGFYWIERGRTFKRFPLTDRLPNQYRIIILKN
jgi:hypothetical protein